MSTETIDEKKAINGTDGIDEKELVDKKKAVEEEANIVTALELAKKIYGVVKDERFASVDPETRHKVLSQKYPNFAQAYPVILRFLARDLKYHEKAFRRFLDKLRKDPGKGMQGFMERQADYARYLYEADEKANGRHYNAKKATAIWRSEYESMKRASDKIKKDEEMAKNEFEKENQEALKQKKDELYNFLVSEHNDDEPVDPNMAQYERVALGLPPKTLSDIDISKLPPDEQAAIMRDLKEYQMEQDRLKLEAEMNKLSQFDELPTAPEVAPTTNGQPNYDEWLEGTVADPKKLNSAPKPKLDSKTSGSKKTRKSGK
jgi:hypothetical protein